MAGQPLIHEGVVCIQQFQNAVVAEQYGVQQHLRLPFKRQPESIVKFGKDNRIGLGSLHHPQR